MNKYQLTADDWVILRLLYAGVKSNPKLAHNLDYVKTCTYIINKLGKQAFYDAVDELHEERRQKEAQAAQPPCACAHCQSEAQLRQARGWRSAAEVAAARREPAA